MAESSFSPWRQVKRWLPGVLISVVALYLISRIVKWEDFALAFAAMKPINLIAGIGLTLVSLLVRAKAWQLLVENKATLKQSFFIINEGYLLNNIFPLRMGEIGRAVFMGKASGLGPYHVLSTIIIERAFDMAMAAILLLSTLPLALGLAWAQQVASVTLVIVVAALIAMFLVARFNEQVSGFIVRLGGRWNWVQKFIVPRIDQLMDGLRTLTNPTRFLAVLFWILATWVVWITIYYIMLLPIAPQAPIWWAMLIDSMLALGVAIPSAPAALGLYEGSVMVALKLLGVNESSALAYGILMHMMQFGMTAILGLIGLAQEGRSISSLLSDLRLGTKPQSNE